MAAAELARCPRALGRVAGAEEHLVPALRELAAHLQADAAVGAGDERDAISRQSTWRTALPAMRRSRSAWMASPGSRQLASRSMCGSRRAGGDEGEQAVEHPGRAAALGQLGEDEQAVEAGAGGAAEQRARRELGVRARVAVGEGDDGPVGRDALDRGAERRRRRRPRRSRRTRAPRA